MDMAVCTIRPYLLRLLLLLICCFDHYGGNKRNNSCDANDEKHGRNHDGIVSIGEVVLDEMVFVHKWLMKRYTINSSMWNENAHRTTYGDNDPKGVIRENSGAQAEQH